MHLNTNLLANYCLSHFLEHTGRVGAKSVERVRLKLQIPEPAPGGHAPTRRGALSRPNESRVPRPLNILTRGLSSGETAVPRPPGVPRAGWARKKPSSTPTPRFFPAISSREVLLSLFLVWLVHQDSSEQLKPASQPSGHMNTALADYASIRGLKVLCAFLSILTEI